MKIIFGSDHAGFKLRRQLAAWAQEQGYQVEEVGATDESSYDYPIASKLVIERILSGEWDYGVLVCGSGIGVSIAANRYKGIRAANCWTPEVAKIAREHNHANVLCLGERLIEPNLAIEILKTFLSTKADMAERHCRRVKEMDQ